MLATLAVQDGIATITLMRSQRRNALTLELLTALLARIHEAERTQAVRALVLAGDGPVFCAGMDLREVLGDASATHTALELFARTTLALRRLPFPTIAKVRGAAIGGGCGLMTVCDFAITHPESKVGYPEVDLGVSPAVVAPWLIKRIGAGPARAMLLRGGTMSGAESFTRGLATHLVDLPSLDNAVNDLAKSMIASGPNAIAATKAWLNRLDGSLDEETVLEGARLSAKVMAGEEAQTRLRAAMKPDKQL
ncbi:MAG: enoyl-CoA hydratase/isomerase family protein [Phycisphaerales bacterium]|nr:enoyl-CoA hydratase/isomerase family protein [Phycisphaerales bacterium]